MVHIDNKERSQQAHTSILNYQDNRQERMRVESKVYLKQIKSDNVGELSEVLKLKDSSLHNLEEQIKINIAGVLRLQWQGKQLSSCFDNDDRYFFFKSLIDTRLSIFSICRH